MGWPIRIRALRGLVEPVFGVGERRAIGGERFRAIHAASLKVALDLLAQVRGPGSKVGDGIPSANKAASSNIAG